ncbi:hypothetical protein FPOAC1_003575 [Fusarium poae]|uniref:Uncharacterized protein n=1 Tax=Fusarium poae TaxID=36050 RepID=A0A1B8B9Q8_FUSPO|nr:hypothetical protein FPOAC1_003575 [Fusarium poae]KAG8677552.1 hypothetical protein FPOAC1_003575 [Fusarium poae]OBS29452.1 hypothetical protein FPOA_03388 [Fusarium poae]
MLENSEISMERWVELRDGDPFTARWGFTIYRTYYGPGSDENWKTLLAKAKEETFKELDEFDHGGIAAKIKPIFQLDARSDPIILDGLSLGELCKVYNDNVGGDPMPRYESPVFLVADKHVLNQIGEGNLIVKSVDADYPPQEEIPLRTSTEAKWWGWGRMELRQIPWLWKTLRGENSRYCFPWTVHQAELDNTIWEEDDAD